MAITDATRKRLWGRSGLRCAYCRIRVVVPSGDSLKEILIGEECHIRGQNPQGPRYDASLSVESVDAFENLLILCPNHHALIDRDTVTFTVERLLELKRSHEHWADERLSFRARAAHDPTFLTRFTAGKDLLSLLSIQHAMRLSHDEPETSDEADLIAAFAQTLQDWGDLSGDLESNQLIKAGFALSEELARLAEAGLWVFGASTKRTISTPTGPMLWRESIISILRTTNPAIVSIDLTKEPATPQPE